MWLALTGAVLVGYLFLPADSGVSDVVYDALGLASASMIVAGVRRWRPDRPSLWWWMAAGQATWVAGDVLYSVYDKVLHVAPFPSPADALYLGSYPLTLIGLAVLVRSRRHGSSAAGALDAGIVAVGLGMLSWTFLIRPTITGGDSSLTSRLVAAGYPAADILILAMLAWLISTGGVRTASYAFLVAAVVLLLVSDVAFSVLTTLGSYTGGFIDEGWLLSYVLWAAAAWHPSMRRLGRPGPVVVASRWRQLALTATMLIAPGVLLAQGLASHGRVDWAAISIGGALLCLLSTARYTDVVRRLRRQSSRLAAMALHDEVTGLGNRRALEQWLTGTAGPARLILIDLDNFHEVNDRYGRVIGDGLLAAVAARLRAAGPDGVLTRVGGDEFALAIDTCGSGSAADAATEAAVQMVRRSLARAFPVAGHELLVHASIGMADSASVADGGHRAGAVELLRRADVAVHAARQTGAAAAMAYHPGLDEQAREQARIGAELRVALDDRQFQLRYQPIVDLDDERVVAVEALVRWHHPVRGLISPDGFIPVAERNGLIVELGAWVLREACEQAVRWDAGLGAAAPERVSVNVSAKQLLEPAFAATVDAVLAETGLPARRLTLEVTETAVFGGEQAMATLGAIHDLGVRIALDDFGTGQSSLTLLRDCPVDVLKVDKSFVAALTDGGRDSAIVAGLIAIIDGLGLDSVAEGIEDRAQATHLRLLGYRHGQGYLFGRPMTPVDLQTFLTAPDTSPRPDLMTVTD